MNLLPDIAKKVTALFTNPNDAKEVTSLLLSLSSLPLNVGKDQLARSILILSDGNLDTLRKIFSSGFFGDPRDVIMIAEAKNGYPNQYGDFPFT